MSVLIKTIILKASTIFQIVDILIKNIEFSII